MLFEEKLKNKEIYDRDKTYVKVGLTKLYTGLESLIDDQSQTRAGRDAIVMAAAGADPMDPVLVPPQPQSDPPGNLVILPIHGAQFRHLSELRFVVRIAHKLLASPLDAIARLPVFVPPHLTSCPVRECPAPALSRPV